MQGRSVWCLINVAKGSNLHGCDVIDNGLHICEHECELCWGYRQRTKATSIVDLRPSSSVTFSIKSSLTPSALTVLSLQWAYILLLSLLHNLTFNHFFLLFVLFFNTFVYVMLLVYMIIPYYLSSLQGFRGKSCVLKEITWCGI